MVALNSVRFSGDDRNALTMSLELWAGYAPAIDGDTSRRWTRDRMRSQSNSAETVSATTPKVASGGMSPHPAFRTHRKGLDLKKGQEDVMQEED